jgi:hypothetical protein
VKTLSAALAALAGLTGGAAHADNIAYNVSTGVGTVATPISAGWVARRRAGDRRNT